MKNKTLMQIFATVKFDKLRGSDDLQFGGFWFSRCSSCGFQATKKSLAVRLRK